MKAKMESAVAVLILMGLIAVCFGGSAVLRREIRGGVETAGTGRQARVILDPGHGGIDAGKTGVNGAEEKEINLKISLKIKRLLEKSKIDVLLTRESDDRLGETQVEDLKARVGIMNEEKPVLAVSIHQNSYHEENVHGAQVFYYGDSPEGKKAAEIMQGVLNEKIPDNTKAAKANNSYYILKKTEIPVIIVECGFLSNYEEAEKLADEEYQQILAEAIEEGVTKYIEDGAG